jgi:hypothetical protein
MSRIRADKFVNNAATGAPQLTFGAEVVAGVGLTGAGGINITGVATAASFAGNATGLSGTPDISVRNITGVAATFTGVLTYEDVTNIDSVGIITARSDVSIADKIIHTGDTDTAIRFPAADTFTVETAGSERLRVDSSGRVGINTTPGSPLEVNGGSALDVATFNSHHANGPLINIQRSGTNIGFVGSGENLHSSTGSVDALAVRSQAEFTIATGGSTERVRVTSTGGVHFNNAELIERVNIVANKLSAVPNVNLDNGMVHYYTSNETTTATPNIISTAGINTNMATGDTMSITIMSKPNNAGYFPKISIDGVATGITTYWNGGSAPSSAESSGVDANTYQIIKTADATYDVLANTSNFA